MTTRLPNTVNVLIPVGALGTGVREKDVTAGIANGAHAIACDAGSTDSGPAYLATGRPKYSRDAVKADLRLLMIAQAEAGIPLLVGSCGTSGCDAALDWTRDIALEIAREEDLTPRIALLYSEQAPSLIATLASESRVTPLLPMKGADPALFSRCDRIVALMGPEPYIEALEKGADIVLGGRTTDTAVIAAVPIMRGAGAGPAWHAGKIAECGGMCTTNPRDGGVMIRVGADAFEIEPLSSENRCVPHTVSAHMLYENSDPFELLEPGGVLQVRSSRYEAVSDRVVKVSASIFEPKPYTMKLEGAAAGSFQTILLIGIQDPTVLANLDQFLPQMDQQLTKRVRSTLGERAGDFQLSLRAYGWNAVSGVVVGDAAVAPKEIGLMLVVTAPTQEQATQIAKTCNPMFFHMPLRVEAELPSYAFPFSPAEIERGAVYDFLLNHVVRVQDPLELVRTEYLELGVLANA